MNFSRFSAFSAITGSAERKNSLQMRRFQTISEFSHSLDPQPTFMIPPPGEVLCRKADDQVPCEQEADLIRDRNFRQTRRRDFDDDGYDPHLREFGGTLRFSQAVIFPRKNGRVGRYSLGLGGSDVD